MKKTELTTLSLAVFIALSIMEAAFAFRLVNENDKNRSVIVVQNAVIARQKLVIDTLKAKTTDFAEELQWYQDHLQGLSGDGVIIDSAAYLRGDGTWKSVDTIKTEDKTQEIASTDYLCSAD